MFIVDKCSGLSFQFDSKKKEEQGGYSAPYSIQMLLMVCSRPIGF